MKARLVGMDGLVGNARITPAGPARGRVCVLAAHDGVICGIELEADNVADRSNGHVGVVGEVAACAHGDDVDLGDAGGSGRGWTGGGGRLSGCCEDRAQKIGHDGESGEAEDAGCDHGKARWSSSVEALLVTRWNSKRSREGRTTRWNWNSWSSNYVCVYVVCVCVCVWCRTAYFSLEVVRFSNSTP